MHRHFVELFRNHSLNNGNIWLKRVYLIYLKEIKND